MDASLDEGQPLRLLVDGLKLEITGDTFEINHLADKQVRFSLERRLRANGKHGMTVGYVRAPKP